ncbi:MAG: glycosyltransferase 87 family protein [Nocardioidaceae bacterium]
MLALFSYAIVVAGDINYYRKSLEAIGHVGLAHVLVEYPVAAVGVVAAPWLAVRGLGDFAYGLAVVVLTLATDAAFTAVLHRHQRPGGTAPVVAWLAAVPAIGALALARFDILPGVLVGLVLLVHRRRPALAATALAVAASIKLWPVLLIAPLVAACRPRSRVLVPTAVVGALAMVGTLALGGWTRLVSPLVYQADRGLQVESVAAVPSMLTWWLHPAGTRVFYARSKAWEVTGPGSEMMLQVTTVLSVLLLAFLLVVWTRAIRRDTPLGTEGLLWLVLAATTGFIVVGRVLSPQYFLWLAPVAAAGLVSAAETRRPLVRWTTVLIVVMALTQLLFPLLYTDLIRHRSLVGVAVLVLALRNALTVWLLAIALGQAWRLSAGEGTPGSGPEREPVPADRDHRSRDVVGGS